MWQRCPLTAQTLSNWFASLMAGATLAVITHQKAGAERAGVRRTGPSSPILRYITEGSPEEGDTDRSPSCAPWGSVMA